LSFPRKRESRKYNFTHINWIPHQARDDKKKSMADKNETSEEKKYSDKKEIEKEKEDKTRAEDSEIDKAERKEEGQENLVDYKALSEKYLNSWKRCQADFENYKKDEARRQEDFSRFIKVNFILQILPVLDNFEASLAHVPEERKENGWVEGIIHIKRQIEDILKSNGIEEIVVKVGDQFNPEIHEAVAGEGEKVKKILQKGYRLNGRIIRATKVEAE